MLKYILKILFAFILFICGLEAQSQGSLTLLQSTFLGGIGNNKPIGVAVVFNKVYVAANFDQFTYPAYAIQNINLLGSNASSKGKIIIIDARTQTIQTVIHVCGQIYDFAVQNSFPNNLVIAGDSGVIKIDPASNSVVWRTQLMDNNIKISINNNGDVAIIFSNNLMRLYAPDGQIKAGFGLPYTVINDIAYFNDRVFVTGYNSEINEGSFCRDSIENYRSLQIAYLASYKFSDTSYYPTLEYTTWGFEAKDMNCDIAYTQGLKLHAGNDGYLYFLGETVNSENIFRWNGKTNYKLNNSYGPQTTYYSFDQYNSLTNTGPTTSIGYFAKINPSTGIVQNAQFILTRNSLIATGINNTAYNVKEGSISADFNGNVYIGGMAGNAIPNRNSNGIGNVTPAAFSGGDPALMVSPGTYSRSFWQVTTGTNGKGSIVSTSSSNTHTAALVKVDKGTMLTRNAPFANAFNTSETDNRTDLLLVIWQNQAAPTELLSEDFTKLGLRMSSESIQFNNLEGVKECGIFNGQGIKIVADLPTNNEISIANLPSGVYFLRMTTEHTALTKKFIVY